MGSDRTWEAETLDEQPGLRDQVTASPDFRGWRDDLPTIVVDDETFYLPWGDVPMDEDQIAYHWAREKGLVGSRSADEEDGG